MSFYNHNNTVLIIKVHQIEELADLLSCANFINSYIFIKIILEHIQF